MNLLSKAEQLHDKGFVVIPTDQNKRPLTKGWTDAQPVKPNGNFKTPGTKGVGIVTGTPIGNHYLAAIDIDCYDKEVAREMCHFINELVGGPIRFRVGQAPKFLVPVLLTNPSTKRFSGKFSDGSRLEVLGKGQQFVAYGEHPTAGQYRWYNGELTTDLPKLTDHDITTIINHFETLMGQQGFTLPAQSLPDDPFAGLTKSDVSLKEAEEIVSHIDPDCDYDTWFRVGAALHHEFDGSEDALALFDRWSAKGSKYEENAGANAITTKWRSFDTEGEQVSFKTVCAYARQSGADLSAISHKHKDHSDFDDLVIEHSPQERAARFINADDILTEAFTAPQWLVRDMIERDSLVMTYGASGAGKSYFAIRLAVAVATGSDLHDHRTKTGTVVYMCGEGYRGVKARLRAIAINDNLTSFGNLHLTNRITDFSSADDIKATVAELKEANIEPDLIIVDTLARASGGFDENSTADMNKFVKACDYLRKQFNGASVMPIHHTGKGDTGVARGSSVLRAAMDVEIMVEPAENGLIVSSKKAKDGEPFKDLGFAFKRINFGVYDEDNVELYSHVIEPSKSVLEANSAAQKLTPSGQKVAKVFDDMWVSNEPRIDAPAQFINQFGLDAPTEGFWLSDLKEFYRSAYSYDNPETIRKTFKRGLDDAIEKEQLAVWDEIVVRLA